MAGDHWLAQYSFVIKTHRLILRPWQEAHRQALARMHADPEVMADLGGPIDGAASDEKFDLYRVAYRQYGISRWAIEDAAGVFVGYAGVMPRLCDSHPLGPHYEIGWRLIRSAWGRGYASESAAAALDHVFKHAGLQEILAYTG